MAKLHDVISYIISNYPSHLSHELSNARLTKMVYLSDWHACLNSGKQITDINWYFDNFGPFVRDIEQTASMRDDLFLINLGTNQKGQPKKTFSMRSNNYHPQVSDAEKASMDHIINVTRKLYWDEFIKLVYSTHPVSTSERYSYLDLVKKAEEYNRQKTVH